MLRAKMVKAGVEVDSLILQGWIPFSTNVSQDAGILYIWLYQPKPEVI